MSIRLLTSFVAAVLGGVGCADVHAQELDARISINHSLFAQKRKTSKKKTTRRCRVLTQACSTTSNRI